MTFPGFAPVDLAFLSSLAAHNDRDWFIANRAVYDETLKPALGALIADASTACAARGLALGGDPNRSQFRIHRDVRFSKNKAPYKTHLSAVLTRDGLKMSPGMAYIHIEPEGGSRVTADSFDYDSIDPLDPSTHPGARLSEPEAVDPGAGSAGIPDVEDAHGRGPYVSAGFFLYDRKNSERVRRAIVADPAAWLAIEKHLTKKGLRLAPGLAVKRMPKGYEDHAGGPLEAALKRTQWYARRPLTGAEISSPDLPETLAGFIADMTPLLHFGWGALDKV
ncbi:DUF2461 domain-containing protein [Brevundimonas sp. Root1423]|uniref:DUF2461 domain-containing protein n=1 Tax=Brevundimonas sp. Root1423 TaxID=1736462 RepID=UPI0006F8C798|nr:DUF2461 domain-containing protein [Brevundimonas sp. Root1423]KQY84944.1 hypothetical protein ASD25_08015 [Brevundimonas sp. Root1423]